MRRVIAPPTSSFQLVTIDGRPAESHRSGQVRPAAHLVSATRHIDRMIVLASVHAYLAIHLISWHVFGIKI